MLLEELKGTAMSWRESFSGEHRCAKVRVMHLQEGHFTSPEIFFAVRHGDSHKEARGLALRLFISAKLKMYSEHHMRRVGGV